MRNGRRYLQRDRFCPGKGATGAGVVGHAHREAVVPAVGRQQIFARALEVEHSAVERAVMRIAKHGAHGVVCSTKQTNPLIIITSITTLVFHYLF